VPSHPALKRTPGEVTLLPFMGGNYLSGAALLCRESGGSGDKGVEPGKLRNVSAAVCTVEPLVPYWRSGFGVAWDTAWPESPHLTHALMLIASAAPPLPAVAEGWRCYD